ncbi:uncharacterized protein AB675_80 [Cyphellophora attinorum]|uniref:BNR/Asp-box repeat domain protein n=1 Tax=Cyphellophora attinorum TaxID=1664694 RepID=A0A0N1NZP4_9EURO|nr:uncharacterized protein AB675_80 [Phialophora attinorum]KPI37702.1 hypothetical protein AB675_80 [Phialophora attinorum]
MLRLILTGILATAAWAAPGARSRQAMSFQYFNNRTIFQSPEDYTTPGTLYARAIQLSSGSLLATWENYSPEPPPVYFPIYQSDDLGISWSEIARVEDQVNDYGMRYQPDIYELPQDFAAFKAGDLFIAGSSIPTDLSSTHIELYASTDKGVSWNFVSHIASGGVAIPDNGETPVWEPFLMLHENTLICYYSDQRDPAHGQKLVHQTTTDGVTWSEIVDDVSYAEYTARPGMPTVAQMSDGRYIYTYEYGGGPEDGVKPENYSFPVFYKVSEDPYNFNAVEGQPLVTSDATRTVPKSSPFVVFDTNKDRIIVSCGTKSDVYINDNFGDVNAWQSRPSGERVSYTRNLHLINNDAGETVLGIIGGGELPPSEGNRVANGVVNMAEW